MQLAAAVIQLALPAAEQQKDSCSGPQALLQHAASQTLPAVLSLLLEEQPRQPKQKRGGPQPAASAAKAAAQHLLPAALQAAAQQQQGEAALQQLWETCR